MKKIKYIALAIVLLFIPTTLIADDSAPWPLIIKVSDPTVEEMIYKIAPVFKQNPEIISKISFCESHHIVVSHDGGLGINITGIHDTTFYGWLPKYEKEMGETLNIESTYDQVKMMSWAFSKGESYRTQWTTYVAYKNGGEYSFYSKLLKANFTVHCK
jgi:hypothetical protein